MRLELSSELFFFCSILFVIISWVLNKFINSRKLVIVGSSFLGAFVMPAFSPGHGELVILLPNAALFLIPNVVTWGLGLFFLVVNFICLIFLLSYLSRKAQ